MADLLRVTTRRNLRRWATAVAGGGVLAALAGAYVATDGTIQALGAVGGAAAAAMGLLARALLRDRPRADAQQPR